MEKDTNHIDNETFLAQWIAEEITDAELRDLVSEQDYQAYLKTRKSLDVLEVLDQPLETSFEKIQHRIEHRNMRKVIRLQRYWAISVAASIVLFVGIFSMFSNSNTLIETSFSEQKTITLLDGSEVIVNAKSSLSYYENDWNENREVTLDGEAFFKVKKGSSFKVKTANGIVTVLGTQFNVHSNQKYFEVNCFEGKVQVDNNSENYILRQSESFRKINGNPVEQWNVKGEEPTWIAGEISFKSVPLKYVISALEKQYKIEFDSSKIDTKTIYTGSFSSKDLDVALQSVFKTMRIDYNKNDKNEFVLRHSK